MSSSDESLSEPEFRDSTIRAIAPRLMFNNQNSIWATNITKKIHHKPQAPKNVRIAIEGLPNPRLTQVLELLEQLGYRVHNKNNNWSLEYQYTVAYLLNQITATACASPEQPGFHIYNNLYSLSPIWLEWMISHKLIKPEDEQLVRTLSEKFFQDPHYIIYLYDITGRETNKIYSEYEWILDNSHCPYHLFKVHLSSNNDEVIATILKIFEQINERIELELDDITA